MTLKDVEMCISELKSKKGEGFDRIPACVIIDAKDKRFPNVPNGVAFQ